MRFTPRSEEEVATANLLQPADYPFEVLEAEDKVSKQGNEMIALKLKIEIDDGMRIVFDYLLEAVEYKLRHFFDSIGMLDEYESGDISAEDVVGAAGIAKIIIQPAKGGYDAKNSVKDYVKRAVAVTKSKGAKKIAKPVSKPAVVDDDMDDEIPF